MSTATDLDLAVIEHLDFQPPCVGQEVSWCAEPATHLGTWLCPTCGAEGMGDGSGPVLIGRGCIERVEEWISAVRLVGRHTVCTTCAQPSATRPRWTPL